MTRDNYQVDFSGYGQKQHQQPLRETSQLYNYGEKPLYDGKLSEGGYIIRPPALSSSHFIDWRRRRLNLIAICICLFVPWIIFVFTFWVMSFVLLYRQPAVAYMVVALVFLLVAFLGLQAVKAYKRRHDGDPDWEPTWYLFLFLTSLFAWLLAVYFGYHNFYYRMEPYYGIANLGSYRSVDPAAMSGQQLMDAGRVSFAPGSHLDLTRSMSFRDNKLYCVAPIVGVNHSLGDIPDSYDFWAVGVNCCCGDAVRDANFQCGDYMNARAADGLRLMWDEQRPFFRLAVQQAEGAFAITARHPLFFHWVDDAVAAGEAYRWEGYRRFLIGIYSHFIFQLLCVGLAVFCFARLQD